MPGKPANSCDRSRRKFDLNRLSCTRMHALGANSTKNRKRSTGEPHHRFASIHSSAIVDEKIRLDSIEAAIFSVDSSVRLVDPVLAEKIEGES